MAKGWIGIVPKNTCWSLLSGFLEVVKLLVSQTADVMYKDKQGYTALHAAAVNGHLDVIKYLLRLEVEVWWLLTDSYYFLYGPCVFFMTALSMVFTLDLCGLSTACHCNYGYKYKLLLVDWPYWLINCSLICCDFFLRIFTILQSKKL